MSKDTIVILTNIWITASIVLNSGGTNLAGIVCLLLGAFYGYLYLRD